MAKAKKIESYRHPEADAEQQPDIQPGDYFVSVRNDGGDHRLVAGPYVNDHAAALASVPAMRAIAERHDPRLVWYAFGTVRLAESSGKVGMLNKWGLI